MKNNKFTKILVILALLGVIGTSAITIGTTISDKVNEDKPAVENVVEDENTEATA